MISKRFCALALVLLLGVSCAGGSSTRGCGNERIACEIVVRLPLTFAETVVYLNPQVTPTILGSGISPKVLEAGSLIFWFHSHDARFEDRASVHVGKGSQDDLQRCENLARARDRSGAARAHIENPRVESGTPSHQAECGTEKGRDENMPVVFHCAKQIPAESHDT
jgi:hypothetical protein